MARRTVRIELTSLNKKYRIKNLDRFVTNNLEKIHVALLTIIQHWIATGAKTALGAPLLNSFESWCAIESGIMMSIGRLDFAEELENIINSNNPTEEQMAMIIPSWKAKWGEKDVGAAEVFNLMSEKGILHDLKFATSVNRFAKWLRRVSDDKNVNTFELESYMDRPTGRWRYKLKVIEGSKSVGDGASAIATKPAIRESIGLLGDGLKKMDRKALKDMSKGYTDKFFE